MGAAGSRPGGSKDALGYAATALAVDTYCQYELTRQHPDETHLTLYRGTNRIDEHEVLERGGDRRYRVLLNNLNSFTSARERADEFGDYILAAIPAESNSALKTESWRILKKSSS